MKTNEVEALVGITKKNIRFYEEQGLLSPKRNSENSYREYGEEEVQTLRRIKLLRKLGVPIEEIRQMFIGTHTVADGMRRHLISLERERRNLDQSITLCQELQSMDIPINALDTEGVLAQMEEMEKGGTSFRNKQEQDIRVRYIAPVMITVIMVVHDRHECLDSLGVQSFPGGCSTGVVPVVDNRHPCCHWRRCRAGPDAADS